MPSRSFLVGSVPFEIWAEIFKLSLPHTGLEKSHHTYKRNAAPITVSHVCANWRDIALAMPQLWTEIYLRIEDTGDRPNVKLVSLFLGRSRSEPLSVDLSMQGYDMKLYPEVHECLLALFKSVVRWKTSTLYFNFNKIDHLSWYFLLPTIKSAPLLESLDLVVTPMAEDRLEVLLPHRIWMDSPDLKKMVVSVQDAPYDLYDPDNPDDRHELPEEPLSSWAIWNDMPFKSITHLFLQAHRVSIINWTDAYGMFTEAPNLISCFLVGIGGEWVRTGVDRVVSHHLRHLYLEAPSNEFETIAEQLDLCLTAPALVTLTFVNGQFRDHRPYARFITRSGCALEELHYVSLNVLRYCILECMRFSPSLKVVYLDNPYHVLDEEFMERMTKWDDTMNQFKLCPNLQQLSFPYYPTDRDEKMYTLRMKLFGTRLCPPDNSPKIFRTLSFPPMDVMRNIELRVLCDAPWGLHIVLDEHALEKEVLWKRFGGV